MQCCLTFDLCDADDGHDVCEGAGSSELSEVHRDQRRSGGHEGGREPHEGCQKLQNRKNVQLTSDPPTLAAQPVCSMETDPDAPHSYPLLFIAAASQPVPPEECRLHRYVCRSYSG